MNWTLKFLPEAEKDLKNLAGNEKLLVAKAIKKVLQNPVSIYEGGYGLLFSPTLNTPLFSVERTILRAD